MTAKLVRPGDLPGYSTLYLDFLAGAPSARRFYAASDLNGVAEQITLREYPRSRLTQILLRQNKQYGADTAAQENIARLADTATVCLFTGQQAGLFTGPMLVLVKAMGLVAAAKAQSARLGRAVIPIFWIAGDDHDFAEVNHTWLLPRTGSLTKIEYSAEPVPARPVGEVTFTNPESLSQAKEALKAALGQSDFTPELFAAIDAAYTPDDSFVTAFGKLMTWLSAGTGLVFFSPNDPEIKALASPFFRGLIDAQPELHRALELTNRELITAGYHVQAEKDVDSAHVFVTQERREPIKIRGGSFELGGRTYSRSDLLTMIDHEPFRFSPDVITRPLLQSWLFPTIGQFGGPAEIAYLAQVNPLFSIMRVPTPVHLGRPSVTLLTPRPEEFMREQNIPFERLFGDIEPLVTELMARTFPAELEQSSERVRSDLRMRFEQYVREVAVFDPSLEEFGKQSMGKIDFATKAFHDKLFAAHKRKSKELRDKMYQLGDCLAPKRGLQERMMNFTYFVARYGRPVLSFMQKRMRFDETNHQLISLSDVEAHS